MFSLLVIGRSSFPLVHKLTTRAQHEPHPQRQPTPHPLVRPAASRPPRAPAGAIFPRSRPPRAPAGAIFPRTRPPLVLFISGLLLLLFRTQIHTHTHTH